MAKSNKPFLAVDLFNRTSKIEMFYKKKKSSIK